MKRKQTVTLEKVNRLRSVYAEVFGVHPPKTASRVDILAAIVDEAPIAPKPQAPKPEAEAPKPAQAPKPQSLTLEQQIALLKQEIHFLRFGEIRPLNGDMPVRGFTTIISESTRPDKGSDEQANIRYATAQTEAIKLPNLPKHIREQAFNRFLALARHDQAEFGPLIVKALNLGLFYALDHGLIVKGGKNGTYLESIHNGLLTKCARLLNAHGIAFSQGKKVQFYRAPEQPAKPRKRNK